MGWCLGRDLDSEHSISDLEGGRVASPFIPPTSQLLVTCHIMFRSHVYKPTFMSGEGAAGGQRDSCWQLPSERPISTRAKIHHACFNERHFSAAFVAAKIFLTSCRNKPQPKEKNWRVFLTWRRDKFPTYQWFPEMRLANIRTGDLVMWKSLTEGEKEEEKKTP